MVKLEINNDTSWTFTRCDDKLFYSYEKSKNKVKNFVNFFENSVDEKEIERISISRTKRNIRKICLCNNFEYFATFTVNSKYCDRFSLEVVQDKIKKICKKIKRKNKEFAYIYITEKHKNGAFHFHGMVKGIDLYKNSNGYYSNIDFDTLGFNSFSKIKSYNKCCSYITKYMTKDFVKNDTNQLYFCSRGLSKGHEELMIDIDLKELFPKANIFENDFCQKIDIDITKINYQYLLNLYDYFVLNDSIFNKDDNYFTNLLQLLTKIKLNVIN